MIKIYTIPNCGHCKRAKEILKEYNTTYEEIDLKKKENREAREYYRGLGVKSAPIITHINKEGKEDWIILEFDEDVLKEKLMGIIPELDEENIPEDIEEDEEEDDDEEVESVTVKEDDTGYARSVHVCTLNTQVEVISNDPKDSLNDIKTMAESLIDKYRSI